MTPRAFVRASTVVGVVIAAFVVLASAAARPSASSNVGWGGFSNTPDGIRHSPLTQITKSNVDQLGRLYTVDFRQIDANVRRGEQSYPVEKDGTLYVTTNDDNVWALDARGRAAAEARTTNAAMTIPTPVDARNTARAVIAEPIVLPPVRETKEADRRRARRGPGSPGRARA